MFKVLNLLVAVLFFVSAGLQWNDPDPLRWIVVYSLAGLACLLTGRVDFGWVLAALVLMVCFIWALTLAPNVIPQFNLSALFQTMKADTPLVEESREMLGLLIISGWMVYLLILHWRQRSSPKTD